MSFYSALQNTASRLITSKGQQVIFTRSVINTATPSTSADTTTDYIFDGYGVVLYYTANEIDNTNIIAGDIRLVLEKTIKEPEPGDDVKIGDTHYRVMNVKPINPAGTVVYYDLQLRR